MGAQVDHPLVLAVLGLAALTEYVIPVFPGDSVSLLGGVLYAAYGWSLPLVFAALMLGSIIGSFLSYQLGTLWERKRQSDEASKLDRIVGGFRRYGDWFLVLNRFFPGVRALFFVAAGLARMPLRRVLFFSAISAAAWNALLLAGGVAVGNNLPRLQGWLSTYSLVAWGVIAAVVLGVAWHAYRGRSR